MEDKVYFCHLRSKKDSGCISVAYQSTDDNRLLIGLAFCSPEDSFCRRIGRDIAQGRLLKRPIMVEKPVLNERGKLDIVQTMLNTLSTMEEHGLYEELGFMDPRPYIKNLGSFKNYLFQEWTKNLIDELQSAYLKTNENTNS